MKRPKLLFNFNKKQSAFWIVLVTLIMPFVFFSTPLKPWETSNPVLLGAHNILFPVEYMWGQLSGSLASIWKHYFDLKNASIENDSLRKHLGLLQTRIIDYDHQSKELSRLRRLLGFTQTFQQKISVAEVIGSSQDIPFESLRIAKGSHDGITVGMPVLSADGLLGRVLRVGYLYSDVQFLSDSSFEVDVLVERTRTRGILHGITDGKCHLQLHRQAEIRIGDSIVTSGGVGSYPKGIPVGTVIKISYESENVSQLITIQPLVDYHQLEEVVVLHQEDPNIETITQTAGKDWLEKTIHKPSRSQGG